MSLDVAIQRKSTKREVCKIEQDKYRGCWPMKNDGDTARTVAVVVIGRNEGERLNSSLSSALKTGKSIVYVDSGSSDGSVKMAQANGALTVELDKSRPFTAARARNRGFAEIRDRSPGTEFVQFLDGDCELNVYWVQNAVRFLLENPGCAVVCGRLRERHPEKSIYNLLCDFEWDRPTGEVESSGGIFLVRFDVFEKVGGFKEGLIAGEESELCSRIRSLGWTIWCLEDEMAIHDANMTRFSQWWNRSVRCGFTYAQAVQMPGKDSCHERNRALFWGGLLPLIIIISTWLFGYGALLLLVLYPLQLVRLTARENLKLSHSLINSFFAVIEKFPETLGILKFYFNRVFRVTDRLIEYK
jgi:GT2 family glycosyltransferase